jgi:hypothetical protein
MLRIMLVFGFLVALIGGASAGPWSGSNAPATEAQIQIEKIACSHNDYYCPYGRYRYCTNGYCGCARCGRYFERDPFYRYEPPAPTTGLQFNFGGNNDDRRYSPPNTYRYPGNGCPRGFTVQDGLCKPYRGY